MCPLKDGCTLSNCQFCEQKEDCVLLAILQKVADLEGVLEKMAGQTV
jgi:hypothetical protein